LAVGPTHPAATSNGRPVPDIGGSSASQPATSVIWRAWAETGSLPPGNSMLVDLMIGPAHGFQAGVQNYTVLSRCPDQPGMPVVAMSGHLQMGSSSWLAGFAAFALITLTGAAAMFVTYRAMLEGVPGM
jgi:hypothetical protein